MVTAIKTDTEEREDSRGLIQRSTKIGGRKFWITELTAAESDEFMRTTLASQMATVDDAGKFLDDVQNNPDGQPRDLSFLQKQLNILLRHPDDEKEIPSVAWVRANSSNRQIARAVEIQEELNDLPGWCSNFTKSLELLNLWLKLLQAELEQTRGLDSVGPSQGPMASSRAKFIETSLGVKSSTSGASASKASGSKKPSRSK